MDSELKSEVEKALTDRFGKQVVINLAEFIGGGCINNALKLNTNQGPFFMKWNANGPTDLFVREAESLLELRKAAEGQIVVPEVFATKEVADEPGFLVQEFLPSKNANFLDEEKLGRGLAHIHKYSNQKFGYYNNNYCGATNQLNSWKGNWAEFFIENRLQFVLNLIQTNNPLSVSELKTFDKLLDLIPELLPQSSKPVLIHGDLWAGNYLITEKGPALIDPASYFADREMEMGIMTLFGGFSDRFYAAYNEVNLLDADWEKRNGLYQLYHILNHYYLFGGSYKMQALRIAQYYTKAKTRF
jgi:protein-ribulosamine 3-kinase